MSKIFLTADLHFGHENIITYEKRPFANAEEMDEALVNNWNQVVSKKDTVIVVGDVSFHSKEKTTELIHRLKGKKILVKGNHDKKSNSWWLEAGFEEVSNYPIIYREWFIIQHQPPSYYNDAVPYFYIYGHVHGTKMYKTITKQSACVSVERWNYTPVELEKIVALAQLL